MACLTEHDFVNEVSILTTTSYSGPLGMGHTLQCQPGWRQGDQIRVFLNTQLLLGLSQNNSSNKIQFNTKV